MKADLTRKSFDPLKHFSRVLMQQGRVQLDADWNEQCAILLHALRTLIVDSSGPVYSPGYYNSPFPSFYPITLEQGPPPLKPTVADFGIQWGTIYVDGILCELEATPVPVLKWQPPNKIQVANWTVDGQEFQKGQLVWVSDDERQPAGQPIIAKITDINYPNQQLTLDTDVSPLSTSQVGRVRRITTYSAQPDLPNPQTLKPGTGYQVYLDVWEQLVTGLEDDSIREVALNGADTTARTRVVWQVNVLPALANGACMTPQQIADQLQPWNRGLLRARTQPGQVTTDPCTISPTSRYRGPENQLYRVEVHTGGRITDTPPPTFKWSRDNGTAVFPIVTLAAGTAPGTTVVTVANLGRDDRYGLAIGDYVEVLDDTYSLNSNPNNPDNPGYPTSPGIPGSLMQVQAIDAANRLVTLSGNGAKVDLKRHPLLRRWDHKGGDPTQGGLTLGSDNAVLIQPDPKQAPTWIDLEDGVQVLFDQLLLDQGSLATYRTGDYWLIPARVATGNVIWPQETGQDSQGNSVTNPVAKPPDGITHHYAPLAIVNVQEGSVPKITTCSGRRKE